MACKHRFLNLRAPRYPSQSGQAALGPSHSQRHGRLWVQESILDALNRDTYTRYVYIKEIDSNENIARQKPMAARGHVNGRGPSLLGRDGA